MRKLLFTVGLAVATVLLAVGPAHAAKTWSTMSGTKGWYITNGETTLDMPDEKTAYKTAGKLNKAIGKGEKREEKKNGFKAEPAGPCATPSPTTLC